MSLFYQPSTLLARIARNVRVCLLTSFHVLMLLRVILITRTLALYNFNPWIIASMCVLVTVLVVSRGINFFA